jgi:putative sterol carrier protein
MTVVAQEIASELQNNVDPAATISGRIKVDMGAEGTIIIDGRVAPATVAVGNGDADCTMVCSAETFVGLLDGSVNGMKAYMSGKLKITGKDALADEMEKLFKA